MLLVYLSSAYPRVSFFAKAGFELATTQLCKAICNTSLFMQSSSGVKCEKAIVETRREVLTNFIKVPDS